MITAHTESKAKSKCIIISLSNSKRNNLDYPGISFSVPNAFNSSNVNTLHHTRTRLPYIIFS